MSQTRNCTGKISNTNEYTWFQTEAHVVSSPGRCLSLQALRYITFKTRMFQETRNKHNSRPKLTRNNESLKREAGLEGSTTNQKQVSKKNETLNCRGKGLACKLTSLLDKKATSLTQFTIPQLHCIVEAFSYYRKNPPRQNQNTDKRLKKAKTTFKH